MEINAIQTGSLDNIESLVSRSNFILNFLDYDMLNCAVKCGRKDVVKLLLQKKFRVNKTVSTKPPADTPLHNAVRLADPEVVSDLLKSKASIAAVNADNNSALHLAFLLKKEELIDLMLDSIERDSKYYNSKNNQGLSHLHIACTRSNAKVIKGFLDKGALAKDIINNDSVIWAGYNCLHFAAKFKSLTALKVLANHHSSQFDCNSSRPNSLGQTPLQLINADLEELSVMTSFFYKNQFSHFQMACAGQNAELLKNFLNNGAQVNNAVSSNFCFSSVPLHLAAQSKNSKNVELLLEHGAVAHYRNKDEMTPAQSAIYSETDQDIQIGRMLYDATEHKLRQAPDKNGLSFMHLACCRNDLELVNQFLDKGEDVNSEVSYDRQLLYRYTPLHFAVKYRNLEMVKCLVARGAAVNFGADCVDGTPLHLACSSGNIGIIDLLLKSKADARAVRKRDQKSALHLFIECCLSTTRDFTTSQADLLIRKLVKLGCDVNAQNTDGKTVLHLVCENTRIGNRFVQILLDVGADINIKNCDGHTPFDTQLSVQQTLIKPGIHFSRWNIEPGDCTILYHHVQKLIALGFDVNPKNKACCERLFEQQRSGQIKNSLDFQEKELARKKQERIDEVTKLKNTKISNDVSLYDFVRLEPEKARDFVIHETLMDILQKDFPDYGYLLKLQNQKAAGYTEESIENSDERRVPVKTEPDESQTPSKRRRME